MDTSETSVNIAQEVPQPVRKAVRLLERVRETLDEHALAVAARFFLADKSVFLVIEYDPTDQLLDLENCQPIPGVNQEIALQKDARLGRVWCERVTNVAPVVATEQHLHLVFAACAVAISGLQGNG